jgi:hypothetical protein
MAFTQHITGENNRNGRKKPAAAAGRPTNIAINGLQRFWSRDIEDTTKSFSALRLTSDFAYKM